MNIQWLHRDKCPDCNHIIWTQEGDLPENLRVQCLCGQTVIDGYETISGGGGSFSEKEFQEEFKRAHSYVKEEIKLVKKSKKK